MKNKNKYTVDEMLAAWETMDKELSSTEETRIVTHRRLWRGYLSWHRRQCLFHLFRLVVSMGLLALLVTLGQRRVYDWLGLVPYMVAGCLLVYTLVSSVAGWVAQRRNAPYAIGIERRPALRLLRPVPTVSVTAVLLLLLIVVTPTYMGSMVRATNAELRTQAVDEVATLLGGLGEAV